jgi:hypothetical protein
MSEALQVLDHAEGSNSNNPQGLARIRFLLGIQGAVLEPICHMLDSQAQIIAVPYLAHKKTPNPLGSP